MHRSISLVSALIVGSAANAQQYQVDASGCGQQVASSPVSVSDCTQVAGCTGSGTMSVGHAASAPSGIDAGVVHTVPWWMNHCGGGHHSGASSRWAVPVVFSGPTSTVLARAQVDYEWTCEVTFFGGASEQIGVAQFRVGVGFLGIGSTGAVGTVTHGAGGTTNGLGATITSIDGGILAAGRLSTGLIAVPTGVPVLLEISNSIENHTGSPGVGSVHYKTDGTVQLPAVGLIFELPEGYTANSVALGIVNNQFPPPPCDGDADGDFMVTFSDITSTLANWGTNYSPASGSGDANHDGVVDFADITSSLSNWGSACE